MSPSIKYTPSLLLSRGYACLNENKQHIEFDNFFSSVVPGRMFVIFRKGGIHVSYGLYIRGFPPMTYCIMINGIVIWDQFYERQGQPHPVRY